MDVDSKVIYNILDDDFKDDDGLTFITLSRMTPEKGAHRIVQMAKEFKKAGKNFTWFLCCTLEQISDKTLLKEIQNIPEFVIIKPDINNKRFIKNADYLVQLSDTESFCYSAYEALQRGVPVIITDFKEAKSIVDDGENGYILKKDLSNLDVDKIFNQIPTGNYYIDRCNHDSWEQVFKGKF
jgi:glycosyltransferase involved in cell wall biosynthesis